MSFHLVKEQIWTYSDEEYMLGGNWTVHIYDTPLVQHSEAMESCQQRGLEPVWMDDEDQRISKEYESHVSILY